MAHENLKGTMSGQLVRGYSAYAIAVQNGFEGTEKEWLESIKGGIGTPTTATTAAAMLDTTKIYVYTGSETGYTYGNWYYYDGTEWVSGGAYASTALITDSTLSRDGQAADAKAVGDALAGKVDAVSGKGLSTNDYTDVEKAKVERNTTAIASIAETSGQSIGVIAQYAQSDAPLQASQKPVDRA